MQPSNTDIIMERKDTTIRFNGAYSIEHDTIVRMTKTIKRLKRKVKEERHSHLFYRKQHDLQYKGRCEDAENMQRVLADMELYKGMIKELISDKAELRELIGEYKSKIDYWQEQALKIAKTMRELAELKGVEAPTISFENHNNDRP